MEKLQNLSRKNVLNLTVFNLIHDKKISDTEIYKCKVSIILL